MRSEGDAADEAPKAKADEFLKKTVTTSFTWPGRAYGGGLVPMTVVTSNRIGHRTDDTPYNHYSMLLTVEQGFGLKELGYTSDSNQVKPMWPLIVRNAH